MIPRFKTIKEKKFVGKRINMSYTNNKTFELWQSFMPRRKEIRNNIGTDLYSIEIFKPFYFNSFNPITEFEKWAAVEVDAFIDIPSGMDKLLTPEGFYAVFTHYGPVSEGARTYEYIFESWLPRSTFLLDTRPHFAIMNEKYKHNDPNSEEEIWIPILAKL